MKHYLYNALFWLAMAIFMAWIIINHGIILGNIFVGCGAVICYTLTSYLYFDFLEKWRESR